MADGVMEKIVSLAKRRGFVYQGSEIYGGLAGTWDYGPLGVALKKNIENLWWRHFVSGREDMYGIDSAILMNPKVWEASGHVTGFSDPLVECKKCKHRFRADKLIHVLSDYQTVQKEWLVRATIISKKINAIPTKTLEEIEKHYEPIKASIEADPNISSEQKIAFIEIYLREIEKALAHNKKKSLAIDDFTNLLNHIENSTKYTGLVLQDYLNRFILCPNCDAVSSWTTPSQFNMMFKTTVGSVDGSDTTVYLRPETAQGMFVNFKNIIDSFHPRLPFGIAQIGKNFRNEIAPRDFIFRVRELEIMELEYFIHEKTWNEQFEYWLKQMREWFALLGFEKGDIKEEEIGDGDRAHYSKRTVDFHFKYPDRFDEIGGLAYRTDFDLKNHIEHSGVDLSYTDPTTNDKSVPHVLEPTFGLGRHVLAVLTKAYTEDNLGGDTRVFLKLPPTIAPVKAAVFPLLKNKPELVSKAREVFAALKKEVPEILFDDNGNVGKRYRRQDEIGTPLCITVDFDTLGEKPELKDTVTLRDRDTGAQERLSIADAIQKVKKAVS